MLCAEDELGIGTAHDGIMELPSDAPVGMAAREYHHIEDDYLIQIGLTPNRVDAASHIGVARATWRPASAAAASGSRCSGPRRLGLRSDNRDLPVKIRVSRTRITPAMRA